MAPKTGSRHKATQKEKAKPVPLPEWPPLQPLIPANDLVLETLLEEQILIIRNFFPWGLCKKYVSFLSSLPLVTTPTKPNDGDAVRVNDRIQFDDFAFAQKLWQSTGLSKLVSGTDRPEAEGRLSQESAKKLWGGELISLNPRIRIYRYKAGQFFAQHYDESNTIILPTSPPTPAKTAWTLLIYLTGPTTGCIGGETVFYPELGPAKKFFGKSSENARPLTVELEVGMALLHKHGQDCLLHEGRKVTEGEKWVIRSDLCVRR
ncbi:MAG: hypothetical protein Q9163_003386 [Psora crenata]